VNDNIHAIAGIAGPWLGVAKGVTGLLSAEAKDVAEIRWVQTVCLGVGNNI
jgi:hypothetical protein